jgi:hypothetical protein
LEFSNIVGLGIDDDGRLALVLDLLKQLRMPDGWISGVCWIGQLRLIFRMVPIDAGGTAVSKALQRPGDLLILLKISRLTGPPATAAANA